MPGHRAKIRMYRHGLGDCLLVRLPRAGGRDYSILIDCGVILGTSKAKEKINAVMDDVVAVTDGRLDLIVLTHAHGDHVSGFLQAEKTFRSLKEVGQVWMAWTENPEDAFAQSLLPAKYRERAVEALKAATNQAFAIGDDQTGARIRSLTDFFGIDGLGAAGKGATTEDAVQVARELAPAGKLRYCEPGQAPYRPDGVAARIMVLGPPRDAKLIRRSAPTKKGRETYEAAGYIGQLGPLAALEADGRPFSSLFTIPTDTARAMPFFRKAYWTGGAADDDWRGIDDIAASSALDLALKLDSDTNNTSLVLAIELDGQSQSGHPGRDVLLFAADAQVGNWQSWKDVKWAAPEGEAAVEGLDLVRRTLVYKVGHHGSHNATLKAYLESMERLLVALNPVDEVMAGKKRWDHIPLPSLEEALRKQAAEALARADQDGAQGPHVLEDRLFYEVSV
ncbi:MBL fold metallo-hydrolase [Caulobacter mirabilis]|uniref:Metallo-beta-lactamase domain-containing protein n=1 Tax=Caulobacter mirabilis TaxID=69666 RepID=A0A2D2AY16_9CAUL|nr:MBL fold metallo-hydrolase [Caulobacter mirabilis]ATQ42910.1 hypothetical protein CSW64_11070 [Caulobacter mirabilis]